MKRLLISITVLLASCGGGTDVRIYNPLSFGAVGDGVTDNTVAIQNAIDACAAEGGGIVELSATGNNAVYVTGPITLKSHVHLSIDEGVTLMSTNDHSRFVPAFINWVYQPNEALISAKGATDVGIMGSGTIDGASGQRDPKDGGRTWLDVGAADSPTLKSTRPWVLEFYQCDDVTVTGITIKDHPYWAQVYRYSSNVVVSGVTVDGIGRNSDGLDLVGVTNATLTDLNIRNSDDHIAIKSGLPIRKSDYYYAKEIGLPEMPTSHVYISNVTGREGQGISIGSEAVNGVHDVVIENVNLYDSRGGFRIKTGRDRGSEIYDIHVKNFVLHGGHWPLIVDSYYSEIGPTPRGPAQPVTATTPHVHDIHIQGLVGIGSGGQSYIHGLPESCIKNITLDGVDIQTTGLGLDLLHMTGTFTNVTNKSPAPNPPIVVEDNVMVTTAGTTPPIHPAPPRPDQLPCS